MVTQKSLVTIFLLEDRRNFTMVSYTNEPSYGIIIYNIWRILLNLYTSARIAEEFGSDFLGKWFDLIETVHTSLAVMQTSLAQAVKKRKLPRVLVIETLR